MLADDRLRDLFNELVPAPTPDDAQVETARAALHASMQAEQQPARRRRASVWRRPAIALGAAAVAVAVVSAVLVLPSSTPVVDANMAQIARNTRDLSVQELPPGAYVYSQRQSAELISAQPEGAATEIFYLLPTSVDTWTQGTTEEIVTTIGTPRFFDAASEEAYFAAGMDENDRIGETIVERFGDVVNRIDLAALSTNAADLRKEIDAEIDAGGDSVGGETVAVLAVVEELLNPNLNAPPALRAALLEVVGTLDVSTELRSDGGVAATIEYPGIGIGRVSRQLEFDDQGFLTSSRVVLIRPSGNFDVPAGTTIDETVWSRPFAVSGPGVFPADS